MDISKLTLGSPYKLRTNSEHKSTPFVKYEIRTRREGVSNWDCHLYHDSNQYNYRLQEVIRQQGVEVSYKHVDES